ncbi:MAG: endolytic transglycosylase MltG [Lysobacteraceae bacterium]|nr:MAG: endolytic transglycosylase MltG [Xanthomonadaceae bacterium]
MTRRSPRGKDGGSFRRVFLLLLLAALVAGGWLWQRYRGFADAPLAGIEAGDSLVVERGDSLDKVLRKLQADGIATGDRLQWQVLARGLGAASKLKVGEYALKPDASPRSLLLAMRDGKVVRRNFTIVEGWNIRDLRAALGKAPMLEQEAARLDDAALMKALGHPGQHPEGRFLPETYAWVRGDSDLDILRRAHAAMDKALDAAWAARAGELPLKSKDEALTLASIVEKETGIAEERPAIAGVFARRLKIGMRLQTDPTVIYGMGTAYAGNIRRADLATDTPYNTYTRTGLPPTPIAMPGNAALKAATRPAAGDALFFVAVGDGSGRHVFTRSLAEHNTAVRDYLQRYRAQQAAPK